MDILPLDILHARILYYSSMRDKYVLFIKTISLGNRVCIKHSNISINSLKKWREKILRDKQFVMSDLRLNEVKSANARCSFCSKRVEYQDRKTGKKFCYDCLKGKDSDCELCKITTNNFIVWTNCWHRICDLCERAHHRENRKGKKTQLDLLLQNEEELLNVSIEDDSSLEMEIES